MYVKLYGSMQNLGHIILSRNLILQKCFFTLWHLFTGVPGQGVLDKIRGVDTDFQPWTLQEQTCPDLQVKPDKFVTVKFRVENQCPLP